MAKPGQSIASGDSDAAVTGATDGELLADDGMDEILIGLDSFTDAGEGFSLAKDLSAADLIADYDQAPEIDLSQLLEPPQSASAAPDPDTVASDGMAVETGDDGDAPLAEIGAGFGPAAIAILVDDGSADGGVTI